MHWLQDGLRSTEGDRRRYSGVFGTSLGRGPRSVDLVGNGVPSGNSTLGSRWGYFGMLGTSAGREERSMGLAEDGVPLGSGC